MNAIKNRVQLIGNIGQTPEILEVNGKKKANFSMATNDSYRNDQGEYVENTLWHRVVAWGKTAEFVEKYLERGRSIAIDGKLSHRNFVDQSGRKRFVTEVIVNEVAFLGR